MNCYTLKKVSGTPNWAAVPVLPIDVPCNGEKDIDIQATAQLCWDETGIYVHLQAKEKDIRSEYEGFLCEVCEDSCLEFFIRPTEALSYFNFEFNPNCALWLGYGGGEAGLVRLVIQKQQKMFRHKANRTDDGWEIFYHIPFTFIRHFLPEFDPKEGTQFYGNCYKCGDKTVRQHYFAWNPINPEELNFHCPEFFGRMILGGTEA